MPRYDLVHALVHTIPAGQVTSYGRVADFLPGVRARAVGYALSSGLPPESDVPWHRVINAKGMISAHPGAAEQRRRLEAEGVRFDAKDRVDWSRHAWAGRGHVWLLENGLDPVANAVVQSRRHTEPEV